MIRLKVIGIIFFLLTFCYFSGCSKPEKSKKAGKSETSEYRLPEKVDYSGKGFVKIISTESFLDSVNSGDDLEIYFLKEAAPENPAHIVPVPGMRTIFLGDMFYVAETLKTEKPLYLISLYGSDARRIGNELSKSGINSYYLDGGSYRLYNDMRQRNWKFIPLPKRR